MKRLIACAAHAVRFTLASAAFAIFSASTACAYGPDGQAPEPEVELGNVLFEQGLAAAAADGMPIGNNADLFEFFVIGGVRYFRICYSYCGGTTVFVPAGAYGGVSNPNLAAWLASLQASYQSAANILQAVSGSYGFRRVY